MRIISRSHGFEIEKTYNLIMHSIAFDLNLFARFFICELSFIIYKYLAFFQKSLLGQKTCKKSGGESKTDFLACFFSTKAKFDHTESEMLYLLFDTDFL